MTALRLAPVTFGWQELDRCVALDGWPEGTTDRIPIPGWVIEREEGGLILYDTGYDPGAAGDELAFPGFPPPEVFPLPEALAQAGYDVADVSDCVLSHLMVDHAGGMTCLPRGTVLWVQREEWAYAHGPGPDPVAYRRADLACLAEDRLEVRLLDGDAEPWPGIRLLSTPGHCPGHQSMLVELPEGWVALAADAADTQKNLTERIPPGILLAGREAALASLDRFQSVARALGALMIPGHDPEVWALLPAGFGQGAPALGGSR
ncbi:MAG TPA: N-acyl homoserine lactonase family protein [Actinomycetota bacterium]|nr:N-acyl homoserine lactonase family protein [Actinomycetota bacterium]